MNKLKGKFDHVISNPPIRAGKQVVHEIIEKSKDFLETGGDLTIVIQKKQGPQVLSPRWKRCLAIVKSSKKIRDTISLEV